MTYGAAVSDINGDENLDIVVASFSGSNIVLTYDNKSRMLQNVALTGSPFEALMDPEGRAVGVAACDVDGDGREEIYILNSNTDVTGRQNHGDKLFKYVDNRYVDLLSDSLNAWIPEVTHVGHSVTCIDRQGTGLYAFAVMTSTRNGTERLMLIEMDVSHPENNRDSGPIVLRDVAMDAGIDQAKGGGGITIGPILGTDGRSDIFVNTESFWNKNRENKLFMNNEGGKFRNVARQLGLADKNQNVRGIAIGDINQDGLIDIVTGSWLGSQRLFIQRISSYSGRVKFSDMATAEMRKSSALCSLAVADFNNDGHTEIFYNNAMYHGAQPNRLFTVRTTKHETGQKLNVTKVSIGEALEPRAYPTGSVVTDIDRDGVLDLLITHGESSGNTITVYSTRSPVRSKKRTRDRMTSQRSEVIQRTTFGNNLPGKIIHNPSQGPTRFTNYWVRIIPKTRFGAPARGSKVTLVLAGGIMMTQVIGGGSGYRGQMEPVAHFGIGQTPDVLLLEIQWPDGKIHQREMGVSDLNKVHEVHWSNLYDEKSLFDNKHVDKRLRRTTGSASFMNPSSTIVILLWCLCIADYFSVI
ncbi:cartilage acidic protein 1-like [Mizuhopecten yessoensis]|nr:cartilage acidic protein 1-like [Mizuhopecten yessoensis]